MLMFPSMSANIAPLSLQEERGSNESRSLEELQVTPSECKGYHSKSRAPSLGSEIGYGLPTLGVQKQNESLQHLPCFLSGQDEHFFNFHLLLVTVLSELLCSRVQQWQPGSDPA